MSLLHTRQFASWIRGHLLCRVEGVDDRFALTFDDGPSAHATPRILDLLAAHQARATFFVLAGNVHRHPELVRRAVHEGHEIGIHGDRHVPLPFMPPPAIRGEIERCVRAVAAAANVSPLHYRPPFGFMMPGQSRYVRHLGLRSVLGDVYPEDAHNPGVDRIVRRVLERLTSGSILILHDGSPLPGADRSQTVTAISAILEAASARGLRAVTVNELLSRSSPATDRRGVPHFARRAALSTFTAVTLGMASAAGAHAASAPDTARGPAYHAIAVGGRGSVAALRARLGAAPFQDLLRLNRVDADHVAALDSMVVLDSGLSYLPPFPARMEAFRDSSKLLIVSLRVQAFAAYDSGRLVRWGAVSTGAAANPTPAGAFHVNWKLPMHVSTIDTTWRMRWCVNIDNRRGIALHQYALPGRPASHCCVRLTDSDAHWVYDWWIHGSCRATDSTCSCRAHPCGSWEPTTSIAHPHGAAFPWIRRWIASRRRRCMRTPPQRFADLSNSNWLTNRPGALPG